MKLLPWIAMITLLSVVGRTHSSVEKNLEVATEMTCEQLLYEATTRYGSITDIEYAVSFALEERDSISDRAGVSDDVSELDAELREINLEIARTIAKHRLFQNQKCPIENDWYHYAPSKIGRNSLWN
ncbi:MAG: hypothetical protein V2I41_17385 [Pseudomonadales bacterium]|nr:hypothetical protein [Pseudomonadales bacterium]